MMLSSHSWQQENEPEANHVLTPSIFATILIIFYFYIFKAQILKGAVLIDSKKATNLTHNLFQLPEKRIVHI